MVASSPPLELSILHKWKRPRADLLGRASEWVPLLDASPHALARVLGRPAYRIEIDAGDDAIAHAHGAVDDDRDHIVADAALHQGLDRIADRPEAEAVARL